MLIENLMQKGSHGSSFNLFYSGCIAGALQYIMGK